MKILFANLPWWEHTPSGIRQGIRAGSRWPFTKVPAHAPDDFRFGGYLPFPFFMGHAAAYCQQQMPEAQVTMRDSVARGESEVTFLLAFRDLSPEWAVVETATPCRENDMELIQLMREYSPHTKIILTGTIVADRDFVLPADFHAAIKGEYEKSVVNIVRYPAVSRSIVFDFDLLTKDELNLLPFPMFDEACIGRYWDACPVMPGALGQQYPHLQIWTSRGCPYKCCFCGWPATMTGNDPDGTKSRSVRQHSPEWVHAMILDRIMQAKDRGIEYKSLYIDDDTFNLTDAHVRAMCPVLKDVGLPWSAMCRADTLHPETWKLMRESGCFGVKVGVESGSQAVIDGIINKRLNLHDVETVHLPLLRDLGFVVHTTWTEGLPGETPAQRAETHAMVARLYQKNLHRTHQLSGTAEITGTPLHTIRLRGDLAKYPDAHADANYRVSTDGQRKIEFTD